MIEKDMFPAQDTPPAVGIVFGTDMAPKTQLGKRLRELRRKIVESGTPLLDWDGLDREMRDRRGEVAEEPSR